MKRNQLMLSLAVLVAAGVVTACKPSTSGAPAKKSADAVKLEFYVMSQCPFGVEVENGVKDALDKLGPEVDFSLNFIGNNSQGNLSSMHGPAEVTGDMVQLCAAKYAPANYMDMIACQNKNFKEVDKNWEGCAKEAKLPVESIRTCLNGPEGKQLLTDSFDRSAKRGARGSPTIYLADKPYSGRRSANDFMRAVCAEHKGATKPAACQSIPEPPKVNVTVLSDKRCTECNTDRMVSMLKYRLAAPEIKTLDYGDEEGKKLYTELGLTNLPVALFDSTLDADKDATKSLRGLQPAGAYKKMEMGATWNPVCMSEGGCALEQCKNTLGCRKELPNRLEVFVMSQCPFGVKALNAMEEVLKNFQNKIDFVVHFIGSGTADKGLTSMHGQAEVDEDIREICAMKLYAKNYKYMDYVLCRNKDIRSTDWEKCAVGGIDAKAIKKCVDSGQGKKLLEEDFKVASGMGIGASPTWLANNRYKFSGIDAESIRKNVCSHNKDLKNCDKTLSGNTGAPVQGGCGK